MKTAEQWSLEFTGTRQQARQIQAVQNDLIITALDIVASSKDKFIAQSKLRDLIINNVQEPAPKS